MEGHRGKIGRELLDISHLLTIHQQTSSTWREIDRQLALTLCLRSGNKRLHDTLCGSPALQLLTVRSAERGLVGKKIDRLQEIGFTTTIGPCDVRSPRWESHSG